jgi:integrase
VREQLYEGQRRRLKSRDGRRDVPLSPGIADKAAGAASRCLRGDRSPVFTCNGRAGLNRSNLADRVLKPAVADLGLPWVTFHSFRHTCASLLFE